MTDPQETSVGLDVGATKTLGVALAADGSILAECREPTGRGADGVADAAARVFADLLAATGLPLLGTVGVGVPGLVDVEKGTVRHAVNLGVDGDRLLLGDLLSARLDRRVVVENDVNAAALGAQTLYGAGDAVYLSIGTGLAAGLVLGGRLRRGEHSAAGEIGHVPVDPRGERCECGNRGCLETIASGRALARAWPTEDEAPAAAVFAAAVAGDPRAVAIRDRFARGVAGAIRMLGLAVDPAVVILGGGVAQVGQPLLDAVRQALHDQAQASAFLASLELAERVRLVPPDYPVAAVGAALLGGGTTLEPDAGSGRD